MNSEKNNQQAYKIIKAAQMLDVHPRTLMRWYRDGLIAMIELPTGIWRVPAGEVDRLLGQKTSHPETEHPTPEA